MKLKLFVIPVLILFAGILVAQSVDYHIRVDAATNLRESYSVNSAVHEKVPAGTILRVVYEGTQGNWLKVERNGVRVWMARWLSHSRVDAPVTQPAAGSAEQPAPPQNVDNCCYVDRQCTSEADWVSGWQAYQAGHCGAPSQPASSSPQSTQSSAGPIDNCCSVNRNCTTELEWRAGWHAYQANQCGAAPSQVSSQVPSGPQSVYEFSGFGGVVIDAVHLARGKWKSTVYTNDFIIVNAVPPINSRCLWRYVPGADRSLNNKFGAILGGGSQDSRVTTIWSDCVVTLDIYNVNESWTLRLEKL